MKIYCLVAILIFTTYSLYTPNWAPYTTYSLSPQLPSSTKNTIFFTHPNYKHSAISISSHQRYQMLQDTYQQIKYKMGANLNLNVESAGGNIRITLGMNEQNKDKAQFRLGFYLNLELLKNFSELKKQNILTKMQKQSQGKCRKLHMIQNQIEFACTLDQQLISFSIDFKEDGQQTLWWKQIAVNGTQRFDDKISAFMKYYEIPDSPLNQTVQIVKTAISATIRSICLWEDEFGDVHMGFCQNGRYQFKMSAFVLFVLAQYDQELANYIYLDYLSLLEGRVYYPTEIQHNYQLELSPQFLDIFTRFIDPTNPLRQSILLQTMFVKSMLGRISNLHEQLNYRQQKKLHPYLMQMLTQPWNAQNTFASFKSIYGESFTSDFKYHGYGEKMFHSRTKLSWLMKMLDTSSMIKISYLKGLLRPEVLKQYLQEEFTLLKMLQNYLMQDRTGKYPDIIEVQNNARFYPKTTGYGNLLSYLYAGSIFPAAIIESLNTPFGLKSSDQETNSSNYNYRGDVHTYFNSRILLSLEHKLINSKSEPQQTELISGLQDISKNIGNWLRNVYQSSKMMYTSWKSTGQGKQSEDRLKILNCLFLRQPKNE